MKLAKELGISDVAIGKICRKLKIPKPPPGYWRKIETGSKKKIPPLSKPYELMERFGGRKNEPKKEDSYDLSDLLWKLKLLEP